MRETYNIKKIRENKPKELTVNRKHGNNTITNNCKDIKCFSDKKDDMYVCMMLIKKELENEKDLLNIKIWMMQKK